MSGYLPHIDGPRNQEEQTRVDALREREANDATLRSRVDQAVTNLEQAYDQWGTLTNAQKDQAMRTCIRVTAGLARLQLRKLDQAGN